MPTEPPPPAVAGILLAAGMSTRMGANKLLLEIDGEAVVRRAAERALAAGLAPLLVVVGHEAERVRAALAGLPCRFSLNADYASGIASSVRAGVGALPGEVAAAAIVLADMPFVTTAMLAALIERYRATAAPLVVSAYEGVNAPPMLYDRSLFGELATIPAGTPARQVVRRHLESAEILAWPAAALADLDVPEDFARLAAAFAESR